MLAEVRLQIARGEIRLTVKRDDKFIEDELWKAERPITNDQAAELAAVCFSHWYDTMNYSVHRPDDDG